MSKGDKTREMIIAQSAPLFNTKGYAAVSMSAVMEATGLEKGGIYRHFDSKEALARAAFEHNIAEMGRRFTAAVRSRRHAVDRLLAMLQIYADVVHNPPITGGCPILNTAVEVDDTNEEMRQLVRQALADLEGAVVSILRRGLERGEVRPGVEPEMVATFFVAAFEGAIMMSKLQRDNGPMERVNQFLTQYLESAVRA